jgi:hypothetical protein
MYFGLAEARLAYQVSPNIRNLLVKKRVSAWGHLRVKQWGYAIKKKHKGKEFTEVLYNLRMVIWNVVLF